MLERSEFEQVIKTFLVEVNHLCLNATEGELRTNPQLAQEIDDILIDLRDPTSDAANALRTSFAYLDYYIAADWQKVATAGYEAYLLTQQKSGTRANDASV